MEDKHPLQNLIILVHQFLAEEGYTKSLHSLEQESNVFFDWDYFTKRVINCCWDDAEDYLRAFIKEDDNTFSKRLFFEFMKHEYNALNESGSDYFGTIELWDRICDMEDCEDMHNEIMNLELPNTTGKPFPFSLCLAPEAVDKLINAMDKWVKLNPKLSDKLVLPEVGKSGLFSILKHMYPISGSKTESIKEELISLILQFLDEVEFCKTARILEQECKIFNMAYFQRLVAGSEWDKAKSYLSTIKNMGDDASLMNIFFEMKEKNIKASDRDALLQDLNDMVQKNGALFDKIKYPDREKSRLLTIIKKSLEWWGSYPVIKRKEGVSFETIPKLSNQETSMGRQWEEEPHRLLSWAQPTPPPVDLIAEFSNVLLTDLLDLATAASQPCLRAAPTNDTDEEMVDANSNKCISELAPSTPENASASFITIPEENENLEEASGEGTKNEREFVGTKKKNSLFNPTSSGTSEARVSQTHEEISSGDPPEVLGKEMSVNLTLELFTCPHINGEGKGECGNADNGGWHNATEVLGKEISTDLTLGLFKCPNNNEEGKGECGNADNGGWHNAPEELGKEMSIDLTLGLFKCPNNNEEGKGECDNADNGGWHNAPEVLGEEMSIDLTLGLLKCPNINEEGNGECGNADNGGHNAPEVLGKEVPINLTRELFKCPNSNGEGKGECGQADNGGSRSTQQKKLERKKPRSKVTREINPRNPKRKLVRVEDLYNNYSTSAAKGSEETFATPTLDSNKRSRKRGKAKIKGQTPRASLREEKEIPGKRGSHKVSEVSKTSRQKRMKKKHRFESKPRTPIAHQVVQRGVGQGSRSRNVVCLQIPWGEVVD